MGHPGSLDLLRTQDSSHLGATVSSEAPSNLGNARRQDSYTKQSPRQCLELWFLFIVGQAGQKGYPDHSQGHGGWGNFSGSFFVSSSFAVLLSYCLPGRT